MKLRPDLSTAIIDPFYQQTTLALFCDVVNPDTGTPYNRDPRSIAKAALNYVKASGIGDTVYFGPEAEFFIFDDVKWSTCSRTAPAIRIDSSELPGNSAKAIPRATWATARAPRAATSRSTRSTRPRTCAAKCWR
jgi:glutamine synthetase